MSRNQKFTELTELIDRGLNVYLSGVHNTRLREVMEYSLFPGGKRFRPLLLLSVAYEEGGEEGVKAALPFACAVEMIHTYSLIHDDLPSMDNDDFRRGKPSCHKKFSEAEAILAGDALLTLALSLPGLSVRERADMHVMLGISCAAFVMVSGQHLDVTEYEDAEEIYMQKTAVLIQAAAVTGAVAVKGGYTHELAASAHNFGMAFQYKDDFEDGKGVEKKKAKELREKYGAAALAGFAGLYGESGLPYLLVSEVLR